MVLKNIYFTNKNICTNKKIRPKSYLNINLYINLIDAGIDFIKYLIVTNYSLRVRLPPLKKLNIVLASFLAYFLYKSTLNLLILVLLFLGVYPS